MLTVEQNEEMTRVGPGTRMGELLRRYWYPIAFEQDFDARPSKTVRLLGENWTLYKTPSGKYGIIGEACPHRRASLTYGIVHEDGIRCGYHGWKYDFDGQCVEQPAEIRACLEETGRRPVELLADNGVLGARFVAVHATHLAPHEPALLGAAGAFVCLCPTTERDLGDGLPDVGALQAAGVRLCAGIDSHVITHPLEELRAIDLDERLRQLELAEEADQRMAHVLGHLHRHAGIFEPHHLQRRRQAQRHQLVDARAEVEHGLELRLLVEQLLRRAPDQRRVVIGWQAGPPFVDLRTGQRGVQVSQPSVSRAAVAVAQQQLHAAPVPRRSSSAPSVT